jgi:Zn-dependent M28 family amino/carboxypeptidase
MCASIADRMRDDSCLGSTDARMKHRKPTTRQRWTAGFRLPTIGDHSHDRQRLLKRLLLSTLALAISSTLFAAATVPTFDPHRLSDEVKTLSSDAFEGRGPATPAETKTIDYVVAQMKAAGLQPGGDLVNGKRAWTQAVPLLRTEIIGTPALSVSIDGKPQSLTQGNEIAVRAPMDGSTSVAIANAPLVFVGYGVSAPERHWDDFKGVDLHGKIAVVLINDPDFETGVGDFGGKAMTYYGRWTYKYEEAARQGALGMLVIHETAPASYGWNTVKNSNIITMFDIVRDKPAAVHPQLEAWIQRDLAVDMFKRAGLDFEALKKQAQTRDFKPVTLKGESFSANFKVDSKVITSHNIVGRIEGSKHPEQTVIYSAHWDHLGVGQPDAKGDRIYNGAVDNATGTAALIELGRAFAKAPRPERSLVFLNVTAEEKGLLGSEYYAAKPLYPLATTVGVINMDALDPHGPSRNFTISGSAKLGLLDDLIADAKKFGMVYSPDPKPEAGHFFRSDHFSFAKRGVPAISFGSGNDWVDGGLAAGKAAEDDYTARRYHQPGDEWQADWPFTGMARDLQVLYVLGSQLANSDKWPDWSKDSEFRATRDKTAAERK